MRSYQVGTSLPKLNLAEALNIANDGDILLLDVGSYQIDTTVQKSITLRAERAELPHPTVDGYWRIDNGVQVSFENIDCWASNGPTIHLLTGSLANFTGCSVTSRTHNGLVAELGSMVNCKQVAFGGSQWPCIYLKGARAQISECTFQDTQANSISAYDASMLNCQQSIFGNSTFPSIYLEGARAQISECIFQNTKGNSIQSVAAANVVLNKCKFVSSTQPLLHCTNSYLHVSECEFFPTDGNVLGFNQNSTGIVQNCKFINIDNDFAVIAIDNSNVKIVKSHFKNLDACAIQIINKSNVDLEFCSFTENQEALDIYIDNSNLTIYDCSFNDVESNSIESINNSKVSFSKGNFQGETLRVPTDVETFNQRVPADDSVTSNNLQALSAFSGNDVLLQEGLEELNGLIGLFGVKAEVRKFIALATAQQKRHALGLKVAPVTLHLVFVGNPGTGKTTVARIIGKIYCGLGLLKESKIIETDRSGLVGEWIGQTAIKTNEIISKAMDGILFIDEAYSLVVKGGGNNFGTEAIDTLLKQMEDNRDRLAVIVAGYTDLMHSFVRSNPGLSSRFTRTIRFEDYKVPELLQIFEKLASENSYSLSSAAREELTDRLNSIYSNRDQHFGNGRRVRTLFERAVEQHSLRWSENGEADPTLLIPSDITLAAETPD